ncbi:hypothetical protein SAMN05660909_05094 [Chitinophaga terrae (ex Kim and Jung 2007)]|uniref:Cell surface protein n=1 Tax=Chitinophaga terrae (ex Kim and Jung 2007) TaxID=408074 RepID=A0A1H4G9Y3_9BACT|nr:hypothetical protein [Chitinophaga terrae (ex Kim and Jung 2007)]GEP93255.1 hypothetical protein CTE07_49000 [Chitinophaga terrae (ex Kim and Jung 2007)]SEB06364.1 hypothetical protein SAMN05660909_05094 [Chitinophaga terrae (ex Kim and Jung 2007)]
MNKQFKRLVYLACILTTINSCKKEDAVIPEAPTEVKGTANAILALEAPKKFANRNDLKWEVVSAPSELYRLSGQGLTALFSAVVKGNYKLKVSAADLVDTVFVTVQQADKTPSPYTAKVFDYLPAPGQFVNEMPKYEAGDTYESMVAKAGKALVGDDAGMITLGGWGGYVVLGFDHTIVNVPGRRDFRINGNAFGANTNPRPNAPFGGSCEPGIVMVAYDKNKNGKPDEDEWYEIKGSGNFSAEGELWYSAAVGGKLDTRTFRNYEMTYNRPVTEEESAPEGSVSIRNYILWTDNQGQQGYKIKNVYHSQSYYPSWVKDNKITFKGIRLAQNGIDESSAGNYYVLYAFRYGYADNYPNTDDNSGIDIDWAIDKNGNKVNLPGIDFIKVYSGVDQENGWLGEASTEVGRGEDLHLLGTNIATIEQ